MAEAGLSARARRLELPVRTSDPGIEQRRLAAMRALLAAPDRPRAIFCWSDLDAINLVNVAAEMGLSMPGDLSVVGYDNSWIAGLPMIGLSSIDQDGHLLGESAARLLLSRIGGRTAAEQLLHPPRLVARGSL